MTALIITAINIGTIRIMTVCTVALKIMTISKMMHVKMPQCHNATMPQNDIEQ